MNSPQQFLDLFIYESISPGGTSTIFNNCTILKPLNNFKPGDRVLAISIQLSMFVWTSPDDFEEEVVNL